MVDVIKEAIKEWSKTYDNLISDGKIEDLCIPLRFAIKKTIMELKLDHYESVDYYQKEILCSLGLDTKVNNKVLCEKCSADIFKDGCKHYKSWDEVSKIE